MTLIRLYELGAARRPTEVSTGSLGRHLGVSQQAASMQLVSLEREGYVVRSRLGRGEAIALTRKGVDEVLSAYATLKHAVEGMPSTVVIRGKVFTGIGEGAYYTSLEGYRSQFKKLLGFDPFPGTLNLEVDDSDLGLRSQLAATPGIEIKGFKDSKRTYGPVKCFLARVGNLQAGVLHIERTHHGAGVLEVVAPVNIRKRLSLSDGDRVAVHVSLGDELSVD